MTSFKKITAGSGGHDLTRHVAPTTCPTAGDAPPPSIRGTGRSAPGPLLARWSGRDLAGDPVTVPDAAILVHGDNPLEDEIRKTARGGWAQA